MVEEIKTRVTPVIENCANELSLEIVEIKVKRHQKTTILDIIADKEHGGISIDECTRLNKKICEVIESEATVDDPYTVEVSSPGLDRPLKTAKDFQRNIGREVEFYLLEKEYGKLCWIGKVLEVFDEKVKIKVKNEEIIISLTNIQKAVQALPL